MQTSGNDIFYRNPYDVNECLFVNLSSPSSSKYKSVRSIGTPETVAEKARRQYLREMMSTRLGVKRESDVISAANRTGSDGNEYYDLQVTGYCWSYYDTLYASVLPLPCNAILEGNCVCRSA